MFFTKIPFLFHPAEQAPLSEKRGTLQNGPDEVLLKMVQDEDTVLSDVEFRQRIFADKPIYGLLN